jgi:hypothetical protein
MRHVHLFESFYDPRDPSRKRSVTRTRDLSAAWETAAALQERGYVLGEQFFNYPPPATAKPKLLAIDVSRVAAGDLIQTSTRPPLNDVQQGDRRRVPKGFTSLEVETDKVWRLYFAILARSHVMLHTWLHPHLPAGFENRRDMFFLLTGNSNYKLLNACDGTPRRDFRGGRRTAAFLVNQPELWSGGPRFIGYFGMDGESTLAFARKLRHECSELLDRPGLHMVELESAPVPDRVPDLGWTQDWKLERIFSVPPQPLPEEGADPGPD